MMSFFRDVSKAKEKLSLLKTKVISTRQGEIEYIVKGSGISVLISHGMTGGVDQGLGMVNDFFPEGFKTICVSRFGYLKSSLPTNSKPKDQANVYAELLRKLKIDKVVVFGNSAGGPSAMQFAINYPDKCIGLILHSSTVPLNKPVAVPPKMIMRVMFDSDLVYWLVSKYFINLLMLMFVPSDIKKSLTKTQRDHIQEIFTSSLPISLRTRGVLNDAFVSNPDVENFEYEKILVPTLIIHAKDDPTAKFAGAKAISKKIPKAKLLAFERGGHLTLGHEQEIKEEVSKFIRSVV